MGIKSVVLVQMHPKNGTAVQIKGIVYFKNKGKTPYFKRVKAV